LPFAAHDNYCVKSQDNLGAYFPTTSVSYTGYRKAARFDPQHDFGRKQLGKRLTSWLSRTPEKKSFTGSDCRH
jgi:hypothetical protein